MGAAQTASLMTLARSQHGAIAIGQLPDIDVTRRWLDNLARRGMLERAAPGVYTVAGSTSTWHQRLTVGLLALGETSWVSHEAAAALHGFDRAHDDAVEFTVERTARGRRMPFPVHTTATMPRIDRVVVDDFRCISATRTIVDLARARVPKVRLEAAIDSAVRQGLSAPAAIARRLDDLRGSGRWGARLLDDLLIDSGGHSMLERRFLELVRSAGLPRPRTQAIHQRGGRTFARVDFLFEPFGVVVEVSGRLGHSSPAERARDAQRRNELQDVGRAVYEYTWEDVTRRPTDVERSLTARLHEAGWRR
jgi:very-short-patch-repair endonuclease